MKDPRGVVSLGSITGAQILDASRGSVFTATLVGSVTFALKNVIAGRPPVTVVLMQDGSGGHAVAWNGADGQTLAGFTAVNAAANSISSFSLVSTSTGSSTSVVSVSSPSGGVMSSTWEALTASGSVLSRTGPLVHGLPGAVTIDFALTDFHVVGPLTGDVQLTFENVENGHDYSLQILQADSGEVLHSVTSYAPEAPEVGAILGLSNDVPALIGASMIRLYKATGTKLWVVGGDNFGV